MFDTKYLKEIKDLKRILTIENELHRLKRIEQEENIKDLEERNKWQKGLIETFSKEDRANISRVKNLKRDLSKITNKYETMIKQINSLMETQHESN